MPESSVRLRRASEADQQLIWRLVRRECLNPRDLQWQNFLIAEVDGVVVGIGQVRSHAHCKELGSLVVVPEYRGKGVGAALIAALEARAGYPLYLMCGLHNIAYYRRFGYEVVGEADIPPGLLPPAWVMRLLARLFGIRVAVMVKLG